MQQWLTSRGIEFPERALKSELLSLRRSSNPQPKYLVDELAKLSAHEFACLSPYHCPNKRSHKGTQYQVHNDCCEWFNV